MANKITKKDKINMLLEIGAVQENEMLVEFLTNELTLLENKSKNRNSKTSKENETIKEMILNEIQNNKNELVTITELLELGKLATFVTAEGKKLSNQKVSALVTQMLVKNGGVIENVKDKKKSMFRIATEVAE